MNLKKGIVACVAALGVTLAGQSAVSAASVNTYSVVDFLAARGEDPSISHRSKLAANHGITGYRGTASQNLQLLEKLRGTPAVANKVTESKPAAAADPQVNGKTLTVEATAYTAYCAGCSGVTATGVNLKANPGLKVIAVDPNVIPLGSKVYVEGYGTAVAADTGGAIKGNRIDVFIPSQNAAENFGRKTIQVTVLN
ncbi:peptidoglycan binding protein [Bacillus phage 010DV004]|nr:peptidoglycan binding protein [Bacillus phage 010DV004]QZA69411.1 peptidoglycan binding protein [Bacillus phage 010DV005]QZA69979.1 peptidoglycan binding protein [Bacillus phage 043JT007]